MDLALVIVIGLAVVFLLFEGGQAMLWLNSREFKTSKRVGTRGDEGTPAEDEINPEEVRGRIEDELEGLRHQQQLLEFQLAKITLGEKINDGP